VSVRLNALRSHSQAGPFGSNRDGFVCMCADMPEEMKECRLCDRQAKSSLP
jgi:hypothetical protein